MTTASPVAVATRSVPTTAAFLAASSNRIADANNLALEGLGVSPGEPDSSTRRSAGSDCESASATAALLRGTRNDDSVNLTYLVRIA